jgi:hypothetical protein
MAVILRGMTRAETSVLTDAMLRSGDLLDLERLDRGMIKPERKPTDLAALASRMVSEAGLLREHPVRVLADPVTISVDAGLSAPELAPPVAERKSFSATVPTVGLVLEINPSRMLNIFAEASGMSLGDKGHAWDGEAGLKLVLGSHLVVSGGYRYFDLRVNDKPDFATLKNSGPFVGVGLRL